MPTYTSSTTTVGPFTIALRPRGTRFEIRITSGGDQVHRAQHADLIPAITQYTCFIINTIIHGDPLFVQPS